MIGKCECKHQAQDELHGKGRRVLNERRKDNSTILKCTVCGKETTRTDKSAEKPKSKA